MLNPVSVTQGNTTWQALDRTFSLLPNMLFPLQACALVTDVPGERRSKVLELMLPPLSFLQEHDRPETVDSGLAPF